MVYAPIKDIRVRCCRFTTGAAGGVFAPALGAGASVGSLVSGWFHLSDTNTNLLDFSRYGWFFDRGYPVAIYFGYSGA